MSCWMLSAERIAQLSDFVCALYEAGYNYFGFSMPESLTRELWDCHTTRAGISRQKVFEKLHDFNMDAYCGRYKSEEWQTAPEKPDINTIYHVRDGEVHQWHFDLLKLLSCYLHQCSEDATYNTPLFKALTELENILQSFIIASMPQYKAAQWG